MQLPEAITTNPRRRGRPRTNPRTQEEWHEATVLAGAMLTLHDLKLYGLVEGGPAINLERCQRILRQGRARGCQRD